MADNFEHVSPGQPLEIPAATWNALLDAAKAELARKIPGNRFGALVSTITPNLTSLVQNTTGTAKTIRSILKLSDVLLPVADNPIGFTDRPVFIGDTPGSIADRFCVLRDPLDDDAIGRCIIKGEAVVDLLVNDDTHKWARPIAADTDKLESANTGPCEIIWKAGSSGTQKAVVLIGDGQGAAGEIAQGDSNLPDVTDGIVEVGGSPAQSFGVTSFYAREMTNDRICFYDQNYDTSGGGNVGYKWSAYSGGDEERARAWIEGGGNETFGADTVTSRYITLGLQSGLGVTFCKFDLRYTQADPTPAVAMLTADAYGINTEIGMTGAAVISGTDLMIGGVQAKFVGGIAVPA